MLPCHETKTLTTIPFERDLEETKKSLMIPRGDWPRLSVRDIIDIISVLDGWGRFILGLNVGCVLFWILTMFFGSVTAFSFLFILLNSGAVLYLTERARGEWRKGGGAHRLAPAVKKYLDAHREEEEDLRRKVDGFNRALEARQSAQHLLHSVDSELRASSDEAWQTRRVALRGDVDAYLAGMRMEHERHVRHDRLRQRAETYRRLEVAMRRYPDSGGFDKTVDLSVYQEVAQAFHEIEREAEVLGVELDELGIESVPLLTAGEKAE